MLFGGKTSSANLLVAADASDQAPHAFALPLITRPLQERDLKLLTQLL